MIFSLSIARVIGVAKENANTKKAIRFHEGERCLETENSAICVAVPISNIVAKSNPRYIFVGHYIWGLAKWNQSYQVDARAGLFDMLAQRSRPGLSIAIVKIANGSPTAHAPRQSLFLKTI